MAADTPSMSNRRHTSLQEEVIMNRVWRKEEAWPDIVNLALGAWLFLTPWVLGFAELAASWNAWLSGVLIGALAIAALAAFYEWEEWVNLALGAWVAISPWVVGFATNITAMGAHLIVGVLVAIIAAVRLWIFYHGLPQVRV
jgi:hypothetical protein